MPADNKPHGRHRKAPPRPDPSLAASPIDVTATHTHGGHPRRIARVALQIMNMTFPPSRDRHRRATDRHRITAPHTRRAFAPHYTRVVWKRPRTLVPNPGVQYPYYVSSGVSRRTNVCLCIGSYRLLDHMGASVDSQVIPRPNTQDTVSLSPPHIASQSHTPQDIQDDHAWQRCPFHPR